MNMNRQHPERSKKFYKDTYAAVDGVPDLVRCRVKGTVDHSH